MDFEQLLKPCYNDVVMYARAMAGSAVDGDDLLQDALVRGWKGFPRLKDPDRFKHRFVDKVLVRGRKEPVSVYEIFDGDPPAVIALKERTKDDFEQGLCLYYDRNFSEASVKFNRVLENHPEDRAARIYLKRSAKYMVTGVPHDWTGVEVLTKE